MGKNPEIFLRHILEWIEKLEQYTADVNEEDFLSNPEKQDAVVHRIQIISEATRHITEEMRSKYPATEWHKIIGMRNLLIHEYFGVDLKLVWIVVQKRIPELKKVIQALIKT